VLVSALEDCEAEPLADWSPVVVVELVVADWSPVVVVAFTVDDWSPVAVVLSIVRLERPRRSMLGLNVEVEPVTDEFTSVDEPVMLLDVVELEPVTEGLAVALPLAVVFDDALCDMPPVMLAPLALVEGAVEVFACVSAMQSWCTGLAE
jgi:hypothetical protein